MLLFFVSMCYFTMVNCVDAYKIPTPSFETYKPRGLRMSIPNEAGMELVVFHVNVNQKIDSKEGDYTKYIVKPTNDVWMYNYNVLRLKMGDKVYVRVVVLKEGQQYVSTFDPFVVRDLQRQPEVTTTTPTEYSTTEQPRPKSTTPIVLPPSLSGNCQSILQNVTGVTLQLEDDLADARDTIAALKDLLSGPYFVRISGTITQTYDDPYEVVNIALKNKLQVKSVEYKVCVRSGTDIVCELASIDDKVELVKCAKRNPVQSSQIRIVY